MEHATMMDLTLHDSSSQLEEDLALITGNSKTSSTARQNNIIVNNSDHDDADDDDDGTLSDVHNFSLDKVTGSDSETEASEEEFGDMASYDNSDNFGSGMEVEQNSQVYSESEIDRKGNKQVLNGNRKEVNNDNHLLNDDESDDIIENAILKKRGLKRKRNKPDCSVSNTEGSAQSKRLLVHKREVQKRKLTDQKNCGKMEGSYDRDNESQNTNLMDTLKIKTKKQKHDLVNIKSQSDEAVVCNVAGGDEGVDSARGEGTGDIVEKKDQKEVKEYWEDIYGRTRDKQGRVIQVRIHW
jgi:hypothetical protein